MKFGSTDQPEKIDFTLPADHPDTAKTLKHFKSDDPFEVYVGCAKWNKSDLKGFYPRGTKDELTYYSRQFNSIELNATFYNSPDKNQVVQWKEKTPEDFKFFPKIPQSVSHYRRLNDVKNLTDEFADSVSMFEEKLGMVFLQMIDNFKPKFIDRVESFVQDFPKGVPLAIEVRNEDWFKGEVFDAYYEILKKNNITNIIVDAAARRDMLHMRLSNDAAFIRYVGANHASDYTRLEDWVEKIKVWRSQGLQKLYFFIHQNVEKESPLLAEHFINLLNKELGLSLKTPNSPGNPLGF
ncbi:uncharacterized protein YecE (DUF72 family) [Algoriphagus sp. 4150]|uniref:DUF72 domain-containing protein n=1 Tax=Algoriphagus sp. 4150 TaxID=2817756 RepID=UPI00285A5304|nr:DUF72 domain-containing protein [Algoriphagus sp. 4150]MDR7131028.1 uncharacterized protein YecE (DUF72 family) [Algoriphagus sp. 4150]